MSDRDLSPEERIICAYLSVVCAIEHQHLAIAFGVNIGRVSEAVIAINLAADDPRGVKAIVQAHRSPPQEAPP